MKILFVVPGGADLGGIITSTEQYVAGLKEAGHDVTFMTVGFGKSPARNDTVPRGKFANDFSTGPGTGELMHPTQGWRGELRLSLMNEGNREMFIKLGKQHDIVIWASVYGFRNPDTEGKTDWFQAIRALKGKHIFFIHDDHLPTRYPWAYALAPYARAFIGVQPCSYDSLEAMPAPRAMVYTPLPPLPRTIANVHQRHGFFMCQVWKGWKNGDRLIAAAPYMRPNTVTFAGDGIQLRYIRSTEKCPPRWEGIWAAAMEKQRYAGVLQEAERDEYLRKNRFLVDLSLRHNSGQINRITQEAMAQGCVVIADPRFITGTGPNPVFKPGVHYIAIDAELSPEALAKELRKIYANTDIPMYKGFQDRARRTLKVFNREQLGEDIVAVALNAKNAVRRNSPKAMAQAKMEFTKIFGEI